VDVLELLAPFKSMALLSERQKYSFRYSNAFETERRLLRSNQFDRNRHLFKLDRKLLHVLSTTTRHRFTALSGLVLDGPIGASAGQSGIELLHALDGLHVRCVKLGSSKLEEEFKISCSVHGRVRCPSVLRILAFEEVKQDVFVLVMPLYPMSITDVVLTLPSGPCTARDKLAQRIALEGLCSVAAFALAELAHGDIKPSNFMLDNNGHVVVIDFGTAKPIGGWFTESSPFSLNEDRTASTEYDLVCLGATVASVQHEIGIDQRSSRSSVLSALQAVDGERSLASLFAEACLKPAATIENVKMVMESLFTDELAPLWPTVIDDNDKDKP
jgi:serine/threonine protein kinase